MSPDTRQVFSWRTQILRDLMADIDAWRGHRIELLAMIEMAHAEANALRGLSFSDTNSDAKNTDGTKGKLTQSAQKLLAEYDSATKEMNTEFTRLHHSELSEKQQISANSALEIHRLKKEYQNLSGQTQSLSVDIGRVEAKIAALSEKNDLALRNRFSLIFGSIFSAVVTLAFLNSEVQLGDPIGFIFCFIIFSFLSQAILAFCSDAWRARMGRLIFPNFGMGALLSEKRSLEILVEKRRNLESNRDIALASQSNVKQKETASLLQCKESHENAVISVRSARDSKLNILETRRKRMITSIDSECLAMRNKINDQDARMMSSRIPAAVEKLPPELNAAFTASEWANWAPASELPAFGAWALGSPDAEAWHLRAGTARGLGDSDDPDWLPSLLLPLIGTNRPIVLLGSSSTREADLAFMQALALRIATMLPGMSRFTFLDPVGLGGSFRSCANIPAANIISDGLGATLDRVASDVTRITTTRVGPGERFDLLPYAVQAAEQYEFVFAADFPSRPYDMSAQDKLRAIAFSGPLAGRYVIVHFNESDERSNRASNGWGDATILDMAKIRQRFDLDVLPPPAVLNQIVGTLVGAGINRRKSAASMLLPRDRWWQESATAGISTPLDRADGDIVAAFGAALRPGDGPISHGVLAASTGSGKSSLLHALILGMACRYSPEELRFLLIDLKPGGVEFAPYARLPHADVVSLDTTLPYAISVLEFAIQEMDRRNNKLFRGAAVTDFSGYRREGQPGGTLPRLLIVVDEAARLFEGDADEKSRVTDLLLKIVRMTRSSGIHLLLASQSFVPRGMLSAEDILGNMQLRIAMPLAQAGMVKEFGPEGRTMIGQLREPGQVVVSASSGNDPGSRTGRVELLLPDIRDEAIAALGAKARAEGLALTEPELFDGRHAPKATTNIAFRSAADAEPGALKIWLGRAQAVRRHVSATLDRGAAGNLLIAGGGETDDGREMRRRLLTGVLGSLLIVGEGSIARVDLLLPGGDDANLALISAFRDAAATRSMDVSASTGQEVIGHLAALAETGTVGGALRRVWILVEPERGLYAPDLSEKLPGAVRATHDLLRYGPAAGLHAIWLASGVTTATPFLGERDRREQLAQFGQRVALAQGSDEAGQLVPLPLAREVARLGTGAEALALFHQVSPPRNDTMQPYAEDPDFLRSLSA